MSFTSDFKEIDDAILNRARNDLIFSAQGPALFIIALVIGVLGFTIKKDVDLSLLIAWCGICLASYFIRYLLCFRYARTNGEEKSLSKWENYFTASSAASGLVWGAGAFLIFPEGEKNHQMLMILLMVILSAATTVTHSTFRWATLGFSFLCLGPLAAKLFLLDGEGYAQIGLFILLFLSLMASSSVQLNRTANRVFALSHENAKLIGNLTSSNDELMQKNVQLQHTKEELSHANDSLQKLATTDALTNLTNRRKFEGLTRVKWQRCAEKTVPLSILLVNIDMFKQYNDFYGQRKGDSCLVQLGAHLSQIPEINRKGDCVARYSGDEFAILLINANAEFSRKIAEKIRHESELLRISRAEMPHDSSPWVTVSVGVATEVEFESSSYETLFEYADKALYRAKRDGRNRSCHYDDLEEYKKHLEGRIA